MTLQQKRSQNLLDKWEELFKRNPALKEQYKQYIDEYEKLMSQYEELINE